MKAITEYIIKESKNSDYKFFAETFDQMVKGITFTKDNIAMLLKNLDNELLKAMSDHYNELNSKDYMTYEPDADLFSSDNNKEKICNQIAEYIIKYIAK
jgi:hypothetical protein